MSTLAELVDDLGLALEEGSWWSDKDTAVLTWRERELRVSCQTVLVGSVPVQVSELVVPVVNPDGVALTLKHAPNALQRWWRRRKRPSFVHDDAFFAAYSVKGSPADACDGLLSPQTRAALLAHPIDKVVVNEGAVLHDVGEVALVDDDVVRTLTLAAQHHFADTDELQSWVRTAMQLVTSLEGERTASHPLQAHLQAALDEGLGYTGAPQEHSGNFIVVRDVDAKWELRASLPLWPERVTTVWLAMGVSQATERKRLRLADLAKAKQRLQNAHPFLGACAQLPDALVAQGELDVEHNVLLWPKVPLSSTTALLSALGNALPSLEDAWKAA